MAKTTNTRSERVPTILNLLLSFLLAVATIFMALAAWRTDKTATKELELLDRLEKMLEDDDAVVARTDFNRALDDAERYCQGCQSCSPEYLIVIPLDVAVRSEPKAAEKLTAAEYNRLTVLGSAVWDFSRVEQYGLKAIKKASVKGATPLDRFMSSLVLGQIHFKHLADDPEHAKIELARTYFKEAVTSLEKEKGSDAAYYNIGYGYGLWAAHEAFEGNESDSKQKAELAKSWWSKLRDGQSFSEGLEEMVRAAKDGGVRPEIACLLKLPSPCGVQPTSAKRKDPIGPALKPAGVAPQPTPAQEPAPTVAPAPAAISPPRTR